MKQQKSELSGQFNIHTLWKIMVLWKNWARCWTGSLDGQYISHKEPREANLMYRNLQKQNAHQSVMR